MTADSLFPTERGAAAPGALAAVALEQISDLLATLTHDELEALAQGRARFVLQRHDAPRDGLWGDEVRRVQPLRRAPTPALTPADPGVGVPGVAVDVAGAVGEISRLATSTEVARYLEANGRRFTAPVLRQIARGLGPTVSMAGRTKADLRRNIVEGTAGFRERATAMSDGAWS